MTTTVIMPSKPNTAENVNVFLDSPLNSISQVKRLSVLNEHKQDKHYANKNCMDIIHTSIWQIWLEKGFSAAVGGRVFLAGFDQYGCGGIRAGGTPR